MVWNLTFNPILVWFYLFVDVESLNSFLSIPFWSDFISVRYAWITKKLKDFQSHFGLILSLKKIEAMKLGVKAFNPILVWFYPCSSHTAQLFPKRFQSHFGLILSWAHGRSPCSLHCIDILTFNPILVWFYRSTADKPILRPVSFNPILVWFYRV